MIFYRRVLVTLACVTIGLVTLVGGGFVRRWRPGDTTVGRWVSC